MLSLSVPKLGQSDSARWLLWALIVCVVLEFSSWFGWQYPTLGSWLAASVVLGWLVLAARNLPLGLALLLAELIVGSQGYLFKLTIGETVLSLRYLLFGAAFGLMLWHVVTKRHLEIFTSRSKWWYWAAVAAVVWGIGVALVRGNDFGNLFLDVNAYLYLALFPLFVEALVQPHAAQVLKFVLLPALIWLTCKTLIALYLFSHVEPEALIMFYQWWRQTGFGEITFVSGSLYRIFAQSQVFAVMAAALGFAWLWRHLVTAGALWHWLLWLLFEWFMLVVVVASLSRSFWLGLALAWVAVPVTRQFNLTRLVAYLTLSAVLVLAAAGTVLAVTKLAWPLPPIGASSAEAFARRLGVGEAASQSRLKLLPPLWQAVTTSPIVGSGFGATVTYYSSDPRLVKSTAGGSGKVTTYAFEWGYLDLWLKLGLVGLLAYLAFMGRGFVTAIPLWWRESSVAGSVALAIIALAGLHMTTPYLNHPLGLGAIMGLLAFNWRR